MKSHWGNKNKTRLQIGHQNKDVCPPLARNEAAEVKKSVDRAIKRCSTSSEALRIAKCVVETFKVGMH